MEKLLRAGFAALGLPLDETALTRFETYYELLEERSKVMHLTAIHGETDGAQLQERAAFYTNTRVDETHQAVRFVTSWATTDAQVDALLALLNEVLG